MIHLTNEIEPEIVKIKYKTLNLKISCANDPLIGESKVKYWTMYIEDDLDIARRIMKIQEEEKEKNSISINLKPKDTIVVDDEEFIYEWPDPMNIGDSLSSLEKEFTENVISNATESPHTLPDESQLGIQTNYDINIDEEVKSLALELGDDTKNLTENTKIQNQTVYEKNNSTTLNQTMANQTMVNQTMANQTIANQTITNQTNHVPSNQTTSQNTTNPTPTQNLTKSTSKDATPVNTTINNSNTTISVSNSSTTLPSNPPPNTTSAITTNTTQSTKRNLNGTTEPYDDSTTYTILDLFSKQSKSDSETDSETSTNTTSIPDNDESSDDQQMGLVVYTYSDKVTPGLIQYSVITFYVSVVFVAGKILRGYLWGHTEKIYLSALPYPDELLVICEGVVISRMQKDIVKEEELYLVLIDLIRSPEVLKVITHPLID